MIIKEITDNNIDDVVIQFKRALDIKERKKNLNFLRIISVVLLSVCFSCVLLFIIDESKNTDLMNFITPIHNTLCLLFNCTTKTGYLILAIIFFCMEILFSFALKKAANRKTDISINKDETLIEKTQNLYNLAKSEKSDEGIGWILFLMFLQFCSIIYVSVVTVPTRQFSKHLGSIILCYAFTFLVLFSYYGLMMPTEVANKDFCKNCEDYLKQKRAEEDARIEAEEKARKLKQANGIFSAATSGEQIDYQKLEEAAHLGHKEAATMLAKNIYNNVDTNLKTKRENLSTYKEVINILKNIDDKDGDALYLWLTCQAPVKGFNLKGWNYFLKTMRRFKAEHSISQEYYDNLDYAISIAIKNVNKLDNNDDDFDDDIDSDEYCNDEDDISYNDLQVYKDTYHESISSESQGCSHRWKDGSCHQVSTSCYFTRCPYIGREKDCYYSN